MWVIIAAILFAFIFFYERQVQTPTATPTKVLADFKAADISNVQVVKL